MNIIKKYLIKKEVKKMSNTKLNKFVANYCSMNIRQLNILYPTKKNREELKFTYRCVTKEVQRRIELNRLASSK